MMTTSPIEIPNDDETPPSLGCGLLWDKYNLGYYVCRTETCEILIVNDDAFFVEDYRNVDDEIPRRLKQAARTLAETEDMVAYYFEVDVQ